MYLSLLYNLSQQLGMTCNHFRWCIIPAQIANNTVSQKSTHLNHQLRQASNCPKAAKCKSWLPIKDMLEFKTIFFSKHCCNYLNFFLYFLVMCGGLFNTVSLNRKINC